MIDAHALNILTHVATGGLALLIGLLPLFSRKGGPLHLWSGRATAGLGLMVLFSAALGVILFQPPAPLVAATLTAGYQYLSGLRSLSLTRRGPRLPDTLLAILGLGLALLVAVQMGQGSASWTPAIGYTTIGYLLTMTVYDLSRPLWVGVWYRRVRPLDHGVKMIGFYFAMLGRFGQSSRSVAAAESGPAFRHRRGDDGRLRHLVQPAPCPARSRDPAGRTRSNRLVVQLTLTTTPPRAAPWRSGD